jgi:HEAT repeats
VASNVAPGIPRIMEALKCMPLPEKVRGWNQVISVEITDRPDVRYGWIIDGDRWHVTTGQTMRSTVRLLAKEEDLMNRLATGSGVDGYSLESPFGSSGGVMGAVKCRHLVDGMAAYLRAFHQPALQEWLLQRRRKKHGVDAMSQEQLVSALGSGDLETRKAAADALGDQGWAPTPGKDAESYWAAKWDWSKARAAAAESAVASGAGASAQAAPSEVRLAVEYLAGHLRRKDVHKSPAVLQSLVHALVELGPPAVAEIHSQLGQSSNKSCTGDLIEAINLICSGPGPVEPRIKLLAYGGGGLTHLAFRPGQAGLKSALVAAGPAVVDPLIASLHDENVNVRQGAAEVLGLIGDPRATASLAELANDPDSAVRKAAAQAQASLSAFRVLRRIT